MNWKSPGRKKKKKKSRGNGEEGALLRSWVAGLSKTSTASGKGKLMRLRRGLEAWVSTDKFLGRKFYYVCLLSDPKTYFPLVCRLHAFHFIRQCQVLTASTRPKVTTHRHTSAASIWTTSLRWISSATPGISSWHVTHHELDANKDAMNSKLLQ